MMYVPFLTDLVSRAPLTPSHSRLHSARLFNAPLKGDEEAIGVSTVGSSEAIILAVLAMKKKWKKARQAEGKSTEHPNLVMNSAVQVCWEKVRPIFWVWSRPS